MNVFEALDTFWNSFEWPAHDENTVPSEPDTPALPYITYSTVISNFDEPVAMSASLWDKGTSWVELDRKLAEINRAIGPSGKMLRYDNGHIWIKRGNPFAQRMSDPDPNIRRIYITIEAEFITSE